MSNRIRCGLFAAAGLIGTLAAQPARADGDIEKPPEVPPEVCAAKTTCPTLTGPCYGYYATKWRVLSACCPAPAVAPPDRPTEIPPASRLRAAAAERPAARPESPTASKPVPAKADAESLPVIKPLSARVVVIPPAPRPEAPAAAPDSVIPPGPAPVAKRDVDGNRPVTTEVVPDTSKLRK